MFDLAGIDQPFHALDSLAAEPDQSVRP
jgi:hypothetical protein